MIFEYLNIKENFLISKYSYKGNLNKRNNAIISFIKYKSNL